MKKLITTSIFFLLSIYAFSQPTIEIYLTNHPYPSRGLVIESIEDTYAFLIKEAIPQPFKILMLFDKNGYITNETRFGKTGGTLNETKWEYNPNKNLVKKTYRYFVNMLGWKVDETDFDYNDTTGYISEIRFFKNRILQSTSKVFCDSLGKPFEVRVLDENGAFSMVEKISYSPNSNVIRVMVLKSTNQFVSRWLYPIDQLKPAQTGQVEKQYNTNGDIILESLEGQGKTDQGYFYDYSYDSQKNWIEKDTYQATLGKNNKIKEKKLEYKISRTIKYY